MKQSVSPAIVGAAIVVVLGILVFAWTHVASGGAGSREGEKPPGMPASVQAEFQKTMGTSTPTGPLANRR